MKKGVLLFFSACVILSSALVFSGGYLVNGNDWTTLNRNEKFYYISGFMDGIKLFSNGLFRQLDYDHVDLEDISPVTVYVLNQYRDMVQDQVRAIIGGDDRIGSFLKGIDDFYTSSSNKQLKVTSAIILVNAGFMNLPKKDINELIKEMKASAGAEAPEKTILMLLPYLNDEKLSGSE